jgi:hypothetical protein
LERSLSSGDATPAATAAAEVAPPSPVPAAERDDAD